MTYAREKKLIMLERFIAGLAPADAYAILMDAHAVGFLVYVNETF